MPANTMNLFEAGFDIVPDFVPQPLDASDLTGDRVNLKNWERAYLVFQKKSGSAGDDPSIYLKQHDAASSGNSKDLTFTKLWYKKGTLTSVGTWTAVVLDTATADLDLVSVNGVDLATDVADTVVVVEVRADSLDGANGYTFVNVTYAEGDITTAVSISSHWVLMGNRYAQALPLTSLS